MMTVEAQPLLVGELLDVSFTKNERVGQDFCSYLDVSENLLCDV